MSENFMNIQGHMVPIPAYKKKDVLFANERKENAYWRRDLLMKDYPRIWFEFIPHYTQLDSKATLYDPDGVLITLNKEDSDTIRKIYEQEIHRRTYGVHFRNGDDVEWITGDHYFALTWSKFQRHDGLGDYGDFRKFQRDFFYLVYLIKISPQILGGFFTKAKKTGITLLFWLMYLNKATMTKNKNLGYMNIEQGQAAKTFRDYFMYAYNNLIPALRPAQKNLSENEGTIIFGNAYKNTKKSKLIANPTENELNTSVFCVPTKDKAFDVAVMDDIAFDEPTKYNKSFKSIWETNKESVKIQNKINGKAWLFNYTEKEDTKAFLEAREIFQNSELSTIQKGDGSNGRTKSELINAHIPAYDSWEGCWDKYGNCDQVKARQEIQYLRDQVKDNKRALLALTRQYANTKREAWTSGGSGSLLDNLRLSDLKSEVDETELLSPTRPYKEGKLVWDKPLWEIGRRDKRKKGEFTNIKWEELTDTERANNKKGKIRIYYDFPPVDENAGLKGGRDEWNCLIPPSRFKYFIGGDPTKHAAASELIEKSQNAAMLFNMPDEFADTMAGRIVTKIAMIEYYDRPELPDEAAEDFMKLILWTGGLALIEGNEPSVPTRIMEEGLGRFMIVRDENGVMRPWERYMGLPEEPEKKYNLIKVSNPGGVNNEIFEYMVRLHKSYIAKPSDGDSDKDYGATIKSSRWLEQCMNIDITTTQWNDIFMAAGYGLMALDIYTAHLLTIPDEKEEAAAMEAFMYALEE